MSTRSVDKSARRSTATPARPYPRYAVPGLVVGLATAAWWLGGAGHGRLAPPPLGGPAALAAWVERLGAVNAAFALVRLACLAGVAWVGVTLLLGLLARRCHWRLLQRSIDRVSLGAVRRLLDLGASATLTISGLGVALAPSASAEAVPSMESPAPSPALTMVARQAPTLHMVASPGSRPSTASLTMRAQHGQGGQGGQGEPTNTDERPVMRMVALPDGPAPSAALTMHAQIEESPPASTAVSPPAADSWELRPGDHLWSVAARHVEAHLGRAPSDPEIEAYWRRLVTINRDDLIDPTNPDLVFPGQIIRLPSLN